MCIWCKQYGDGHERWFYNPANYARRLYKIRKAEAEATGAEANPQAAGGMALGGLELIKAMDSGDTKTVARIVKESEEQAWRVHFGQVLSLDEALKAIDVMYPIATISCVCKRSMRCTADNDNFVCMGMGPGMYKWERWPDTYRGGVEFLSPGEAKERVTRFHKQGLVQSVATFGTPYLGGLCNCDYPDCGFIRSRLDYGIRALWKGHYVARVDAAACTGCAKCIKRCQFRALSYVPSQNKAYIDMGQCFGCGLCATVCAEKAISLVERSTMPALANSW